MRVLSRFVFAAVLAGFMFGCAFNTPSEPVSVNYTIRYEITGTLTGSTTSAMAQFTTASGGNVIQQYVTLPWVSDDYTLKTGDSAIVQGVFMGDAINVTLKIYRNGTAWKTGSLNTTSMGSVSVQGTL